jgi:molecular chaperone Hsp33
MSDASTPVNPAASGIEARTSFVRGRHALWAEADLSELLVDYYLHLADHGLTPDPAHDALFKRALAAFILHLVSQPWNVMNAWTLNFHDPRLNLFLTGDNEDGAVTGRVFTEHVKPAAEHLFYVDTVRGRQPKRRSLVSFTTPDPVLALERFYAQSEQRLARCFELGEDRWVLVSEHPDCDLAWLRDLDMATVRQVPATETLAPLERRIYRWHCGCNQRRMLEVVAPVFRAEPEELFDGDERLEMRCPRCAARHLITREALEAFVQEGA